MLRGLLKLGLLAGAGLYAYRKLRAENGTKHQQSTDDLFGTADQRRGKSDLTRQITKLVNQAAEAVRQRTATNLGTSSNTGHGSQYTKDATTPGGAPREAYAAAMAAMPAVQPNEAFPEMAAELSTSGAGTANRR